MLAACKAKSNAHTANVVCLLQVSCNDWHLESELSSAYLLEKLVYSMQEAGVEAGPPQDGADNWVASPYAALQPCTIQGPDDERLKGTWQRPWADEMEVSESSSQLLTGLFCSIGCAFQSMQHIICFSTEHVAAVQAAPTNASSNRKWLQLLPQELVPLSRVQYPSTLSLHTISALTMCIHYIFCSYDAAKAHAVFGSGLDTLRQPMNNSINHTEYLVTEQDQECSPQDIRRQADPANRSSRMEVLLVRSVEKALDAVNGLLKPTSWNALLSKDDGLRVLQVSSRNESTPVLSSLLSSSWWARVVLSSTMFHDVLLTTVSAWSCR